LVQNTEWNGRERKHNKALYIIFTLTKLKAYAITKTMQNNIDNISPLNQSNDLKSGNIPIVPINSPLDNTAKLLEKPIKTKGKAGRPKGTKSGCNSNADVLHAELLANQRMIGAILKENLKVIRKEGKKLKPVQLKYLGDLQNMINKQIREVLPQTTKVKPEQESRKSIINAIESLVSNVDALTKAIKPKEIKGIIEELKPEQPENNMLNETNNEKPL
jgi:hypothetical protein